MYDLMSSRMRRKEIHRGYAVAVEQRVQSIAAWDRATPEDRGTRGGPPLLRPVPLRPLKTRAIDELIAVAKERMLETVNVGKAEETRSALVAYLRRAQRRMASHDTAQGTQAGIQAVMAEAKLTGLVVDQVEQRGTLGIQLAESDRAALARYLEATAGAPR